MENRSMMTLTQNKIKEEEPFMKKTEKDYVLPVTTYLNQKIVFDLLAVIEDGLSQVTNLNISNTSGSTTTGNADGKFC